MRSRDLIDRFGKEEDAFLRAEFVAPVTAGGKVRVRIAQVVCEMTVRDPRPGLMVLRPRSAREAAIAREASLGEARRYLRLFPRARLVASLRYGETWLGLPAAAPAKGVRVEGLVPITLAKGLQLFQTVVVRFDGSLFLQETTERHAVAAFLRDELDRATLPGEVRRSGLTGPERLAYAHQHEFQREMAMGADERRLRRALELAGASLHDFTEREGIFTVRYRVDGTLHTSLVGKRDLTVVSAGICLSGQDSDFDLTSLVGVLRQHREEEE
jgi:hypothetical protein